MALIGALIPRPYTLLQPLRKRDKEAQVAAVEEQLRARSVALQDEVTWLFISIYLSTCIYIHIYVQKG